MEKELVTQNNQLVNWEAQYEDLKERRIVLARLQKDMLKDGTHFGVIPGTEKPCLYKAGAELLCSVFRLSPRFRVSERDTGGGHREYSIICELWSGDSLLGEGVGLATTMESKHRWRNSELTCPACGREGTVFKSKKEDSPGYYCWAKKGGCGAKFKLDDPDICSQTPGQVENKNIADTYNTVLKMAKKRALVDAVLTVCGASDIYTQDLEDGVDIGYRAQKAAPQAEPSDPHDHSLIANDKNGLNVVLSKVKSLDDITKAWDWWSERCGKYNPPSEVEELGKELIRMRESEFDSDDIPEKLSGGVGVFADKS